MAALAVAAAPMSPMLEQVSAQSGPGIVISEFRFRGPAGVNDEFIELFNAGTAPVDVGGWLVRVSNNNRPPTVVTRATIPANTIINPGCFYLVANTSSSGGYTGGVAPNLSYALGFADEGGVGLTLPDTTTIVDQVGHGANGAFGEGTRLTAVFTNVDRGIERRPGGTAGHVDTNDNAADFREITPGNPQNASSACITAAVLLPHDVQGAGSVSPLAGTIVSVRGVVTARALDGFFLQTEPGSEDADANTSEGLFVFTGGAPAAAPAGHLVQVTGSVSEFVPAADPASPSRTQLTAVSSVTDLGAATPPEPYALTAADLPDTGTPDQLERLEGMRVTVPSLTAVSPTGGLKDEPNASSASDGAFYAVVAGARPFREPGIETGYPMLPCALAPCNIASFDANPERLRVDSDALEGTTAVNVTTGAVMMDVTGPLDFASRAYTLLPESTPAPLGGMAIVAAPAAEAGEFSIASFNVDRFYDAGDDPGGDPVLTAAAYDTRLAKASQTIRNVMNMPDIIGFQEVEHLAVLQDVANRVDADAAPAGQPAPNYAAYLFEGVDADGLDVGVLVKSGRVSVISAEPIGTEVNDRPSLLLQAMLSGPATMLPQTVTVIVNQLSPLSGAERDDATGQMVRARRQAQAEFLANFVQGRQLNDPAEAIVSIGDYNAFGFNDGYVDTVGTIRGVPAPPDQVVTASPDLVSPDLVDAGEVMPAGERYSFVFDGNAQSFDHVLVTANLTPQFAGLARPRVNADFPEALRGDETTASRLSDRDPVVAYFAFPPDVDAPVFSFLPQDDVAEATSASGAAVGYDVPAATDNLDPVVTVSCAPASGSVFPLGNSGVTCTAQDLAGNVATAAFTITVQDTTAPALTVPADLTGEAQSPAGVEVNFVATATDAVTAEPVVSCTPASGSTFAVGATTVTCVASDDAGNSSSGSFTVTIAEPVLGRMHGTGTVDAPDQQFWFQFEVREAANYVERGRVTLRVHDTGAPDRYLAADVSDVSFSADRRTVEFSGIGSWNGEAGYRFHITARDRGEPGPGQDAVEIVVTSPSGDVVAETSGVLRDGNLQSLR
jgi:hypothetical protein